ncbi:MAG: HNH endonuclease [Planctomycetes bacterium]|nr:HNH endonuclease [Planctomycetota bacterium]
MARLALPEPTADRTSRDARHDARAYWSEALWFELCAYCLLSSDALELDHHEPRQFAPDRAGDPLNLRLACRNCNGRKGDYHPAHATRRRKAGVATPRPVPDIARDDFGQWFELLEDGSLGARGGAFREHAVFALVLFPWCLDPFVRRRAELLDKLRLCERALLHEPLDAHGQALLETILRDLARQCLLLIALDVSISDALWNRLRGCAATLSRQRPGS